MKRLFVVTVWTVMQVFPGFSQKAINLYKKGMVLSDKGKYEEALKVFDKSLKADSNLYLTWYERGILNYTLNNKWEAYHDFSRTLALNPNFAQALLYRGSVNKDIADYRAALRDYTDAKKLDANYDNIYLLRGIVYEMIGMNDSACDDYRTALDLGYSKADDKVKLCDEPVDEEEEIFYITELTGRSTDNAYGVSNFRPVKVGKGPLGGPNNQRMYLNLLRDAMGRPLKYIRKGSCCAYDSENGFMGKALVDVYEVYYYDKHGNQRFTYMYLSFYDYENPQVPTGFYTVSDF